MTTQLRYMAAKIIFMIRQIFLNTWHLKIIPNRQKQMQIKTGALFSQFSIVYSIVMRARETEKDFISRKWIKLVHICIVYIHCKCYMWYLMYRTLIYYLYNNYLIHYYALWMRILVIYSTNMYLSLSMIKPTKPSVCPAKTQISLDIHPVLLEPKFTVRFMGS